MLNELQKNLKAKREEAVRDTEILNTLEALGIVKEDAKIKDVSDDIKTITSALIDTADEASEVVPVAWVDYIPVPARVGNNDETGYQYGFQIIGSKVDRGDHIDYYGQTAVICRWRIIDCRNRKRVPAKGRNGEDLHGVSVLKDGRPVLGARIDAATNDAKRGHQIALAVSAGDEAVRTLAKEDDLRTQGRRADTRSPEQYEKDIDGRVQSITAYHDSLLNPNKRAFESIYRIISPGLLRQAGGNRFWGQIHPNAFLDIPGLDRLTGIDFSEAETVSAATPAQIPADEVAPPEEATEL